MKSSYPVKPKYLKEDERKQDKKIKRARKKANEDFINSFSTIDLLKGKHTNYWTFYGDF